MFLIGCRVADFVVALALKTISSSIPAYIGQRFDIPCEDVGRVMRLCISGFELFTAGRENATLLLDQVKVRRREARCHIGVTSSRYMKSRRL
jgi:phage gp36-like protein